MSDAADCPYCNEKVTRGAERCPHCGEHLVARPRAHVHPGSSRLKAAGVLQMILGAMSAFIVPCVLLGIFVQSALPAAQRPSLGSQVAGIFVYVGLAVFFGWTGLGAWRHRRWARPIMLALSVPGLVMGVIASAAMIAMSSTMLDMSLRMAASAGGPAAAPPPGLMQALMLVSVVIGVGIYIGLPGLFAGLYWGEDLRRVCEEIDERPRWTDGVPIPIIGMSLWLALLAAGSVFVPAYGVAPIFGVLLTGWATIAYALVLAVVSGGLAVAVFRRQPIGWVGTLCLVLALGASHMVSFARVPMIDIYRAMNMPRAQLEALESVDLSAMNQVALGGGGAVLVALVGFLGWARRFFVKT
jgi:hypothetical protein